MSFFDSLNMDMETEQGLSERRDFFNCVENYYGGGTVHFSKPEMLETDEYRHQIKGFFHNEPCLYNHRIYEHATVIYNAMRKLLSGVKQELLTDARRRRKREDEATTTTTGEEKEEKGEGRRQEESCQVPSNDFSSANEKRLSFSLVFQTLKYQKFLQEMLQNSGFFDIYPKLEDEFSCVMVILCDYQTRKFQRRLAPPSADDILLPQMSVIEDALHKSKTKLHAALARSRISSRVQSLDSLLPDVVRNNDRIGSFMHIGCWINHLKTTYQSMYDDLMRDGFSLIQSENDLTGKTFLIDRHCSDLIFFPHDLIDYLEALPIVKRKALIIQDKSSCIGAQSIRSLISDGDDLIHVNVGAGMTTAHVISLSFDFSGFVFAFGIETDNQLKHVALNLDKFGAKGRVKVVNEKFVDLDLNDARFKDIKVILITANCTRAGVPNPVNFIVSEGEDYDFTSYASILRDLSFGQIDSEQVTELISKNMATLKHALQFPRVQTVVFCTRSLSEWENEAVVNASIDYINTVEQTKTPFRLSPPLLPLSEEEIEAEAPLYGKFIKFSPSQFTSGCFMATISREADDPKEAAKDILARAAARGIISGLPAAVGVDSSHSKSKAKPSK